MLSSLAIALLAGMAVVCLLSLGWALRFRHQLGALRVRHAESVRVSRAKTRTVAGVTHELRTPLTAVIGFSELLHAGRAGALNPRQDEYLGVVRSSAGHLLALIDETLDAASIEAGHVCLKPIPVDPDLVAAECLAALAPLAATRRVALEHCRAPLGTALLDVARLRQVIDNFVGNAIKFTEPGGRVVVALNREDERLSIAVSDTGIGIDEADRERIFDEFVQLQDGRRPGSGLGLSLTRQIVAAQGGEVGVDSTPGAGSTFTAWLPWLDAAAQSGPHERPGAQGPTTTPDPFAGLSGVRRFSRRREPRATERADAASRPASARAARP